MQLRYYQNDGIQDITDFFKSGGLHCIRQAATGSGKTVEFTHLANLVAKKYNKILILTNRDLLLQQTGSALKKNGLNAMYIQAGAKVVSNAFNCYVAMAQTLRRRIDQEYWIDFLKSIDLLIIDECHIQDFNYIYESGIFSNKHYIGFTATPRHTGKMRQLALDYETIIEGIPVSELIKQGYLVSDDYVGIEPPDLSDVKFDHKKGDYMDSSLFQKYNTPTAYGGAVRNYKEICPNTKTICFCVNIEHCIRTAIAFNDAGISAKFIVSTLSPPRMPENEENAGKMAGYNERKRVYDLFQENKHLTGPRKDIFEGFDQNKFKILINAGIATTGFDQPDIETVIVLRATLSTTLWLQMLGRGSRISPGKTHFNILDFGGNAERLGHYTETRLWSLWHEKFEGEGLPPIKTCGFNSDRLPIVVNEKGGCGRPILASYKICPFCGFKYPEKVVKEIDLRPILFNAQTKTAVRTKRIKDMTNQELYDYRKDKGHQQAWVWRQLWYRKKNLEDKIESIESFGKEFDWSSATIKKAIEFMS